MTDTATTKCYYCNQPIEEDAEYDGWVHTDGGEPMCEGTFSWEGADDDEHFATAPSEMGL